jgi:hypothetical protein
MTHKVPLFEECHSPAASGSIAGVALHVGARHSSYAGILCGGRIKVIGSKSILINFRRQERNEARRGAEMRGITPPRPGDLKNFDHGNRKFQVPSAPVISLPPFGAQS